MELHPSPRSWRIALVTAIGSGSATALAVALLALGSTLPVLWGLVAFASLATFVPAVGALSAAVDADERGVTVRRFGRARHYSWDVITAVEVVERRASVPDGTEYHWVLPSRRHHVVAVPALELGDGTRRQLPALAVPATDGERGTANEIAAMLMGRLALRLRSPA